MKKVLCSVLALIFLTASVSACPDYYVEESYDDCSYYDDDTEVMAHWANVRDACGNIIGRVCEGDAVEVLGQCPDNPARSIVYNYNTGSYGTVASVYIYGGTAYQYENPNDYFPRADDITIYDNYGCAYKEETYYENDPTLEIEYDETTPWACDDLVAYERDCSYDYSYDYCYESSEYYTDTYVYDGCYYEEEVYYDSCDEDDSYFTFYDEGEIRVDVDISAQVVNIYQGSTILLSGSCVTGMAGAMDTPCGQYTILSKERGATLVGDDYECPVDYWMPFYGGCGFHDASWRDDFGGDIYQYDGSHGCINLEEGFVEQMYEIVPEGCCVNIH